MRDTKMFKYESVKSCIKCNAADPWDRVTWSTIAWIEQRDMRVNGVEYNLMHFNHVKEAIKRTCKECGYWHLEFTADHEDKDVEFVEPPTGPEPKRTFAEMAEDELTELLII